MKKTILMWLATILLVCSSTAFAGLFDDRFPSARLTGMGGSGVAVNSGVWASYYNPAALSQTGEIALGSTYLKLFNLSFFDNLFAAGTYPISPKYGTLSLSFQYFGVNYQGKNLSGEYTFALSHGFNLLKDIHSSLSFGYSLKYYQLTLEESVEGVELGNAGVFGLDVGFQASVYSRTFVGLYFLNVNSPSIGSEVPRDLPQRVVIGVAYQPYDGVTTTLDINRSMDAGQNEVWGGAEFRVFDLLDLRFGGTTNPNRFTAGFGLKIDKFDLDYAIKTHSDLGETHAVSLGYRL